MFTFPGIPLDEYLGIWKLVIPLKDTDEKLDNRNYRIDGQFTLYRIASNTLGSKQLFKVDNDWTKYCDSEGEHKYKISGSIIRSDSDSYIKGVYRSGGCITWHKTVKGFKTKFSKTPFEIWVKYGR